MADAIRVIKGLNYRMMSNVHLKDRRLSWNAKGILSAMLSLSGEYTIDELAELTANGMKDTEAGVVELERHGYLTWRQKGDIFGVPDIEYIVYEQPVDSQYSPDPEAEHPNEEDIPGQLMEIKFDGEDSEMLRERLRVNGLAKKYSRDFVEMAFGELCRRDVAFRRIISASAFEYVCFAVCERQHSESNYELPKLINMYFDNIMWGIKDATNKAATSHRGGEIEK